MGFSPVYTERVLDPSYANWRRSFSADAMQVHRAHLVMLSERSLIPSSSVEAIRKGIDLLETRFNPPEHIPEEVEDLYFLFEQELGKLIGPEHAGYLHTARSRNDMDTTVFRLTLKNRLEELLESLLDSCTATLERARSVGEALIVLYTHGQPANVSTLAHYLTAFLGELIEDAETLWDSIGAVDRSTMGACAITTTGFDVDRGRVSDLLGFARPLVNSYRAISTSHWLTRPAAAGAALMTDLTRFAMDLSHKASCEVGILEFPDELVQISSIMPQKRNPVIIEHIRIQAGLARGDFRAVEELFGNVPLQDVNEVADAPVERMLSGIEMAHSALALLAETVRHVHVNEEVVERVALESGATTTELADTMVRELGMSFREAHSLTQVFVRSGYDKEALREAFTALREDRLPYDDARIDEILSPSWFVKVRKALGGPAPEGMHSVFAEADAASTRLRTELARLRKREEAAASQLLEAYTRL